MSLPKRKGRPPLSDKPSTDVCVAMPPAMYDRAYQLAVRARVSVPEIVRRAVDRLCQFSDTNSTSSRD
jgi:NAD(P)H-flavin reductase